MVMAQDAIHAAREAGAPDPIAAAADASRRVGGDVFRRNGGSRHCRRDDPFAAFHGAERGITVATSNRHADELYKNGLHRDRFLPFIELLKTKCDISGAAGRTGAPACWQACRPGRPADDAASQALDEGFRRLAGAAPVTAEIIRVAGREIGFEQVVGDVACASFAALCEAPLAARDYLAIAGRFAGLVIDGVPALTDEEAAARFSGLSMRSMTGSVS